jgi:hypothetical protein
MGLPGYGSGSGYFSFYQRPEEISEKCKNAMCLTTYFFPEAVKMGR